MATEVPVSDLKVGDYVYIYLWNNSIIKVPVLGFGKDMFICGRNVKGLPFVEAVNTDEHNLNNYIYDKVVRRA
jgi:hypothetical protein